jgi:dihydroorotate dehydrogenase
MIFEGPSLIGQLNRELVEFLKKDGYTNISQAVGAYHRS